MMKSMKAIALLLIGLFFVGNCYADWVSFTSATVTPVTNATAQPSGTIKSSLPVTGEIDMIFLRPSWYATSGVATCTVVVLTKTNSAALLYDAPLSVTLTGRNSYRSRATGLSDTSGGTLTTNAGIERVYLSGEYLYVQAYNLAPTNSRTIEVRVKIRPVR